MWKLSEVRFLTAYGDIRSSPAKMTSMEELVMVRPMEGQSRGRSVDGSWINDPIKGLQRRMLFEPASSDTKQMSPPEEDAGETPGGIIGIPRRYHFRFSGSKRKPS